MIARAGRQFGHVYDIMTILPQLVDEVSVDAFITS
jgi:hypothetical protein